ncbi:MAG: hypothetical protein SCALA702_05010 [Melioribacteraceae bacterium]|nr:MAG: hypothetical protein SCALA702_05010 [Melioribacteraceae bacterium]
MFSILVWSCTNPFAPKLDETAGSTENLISDQSDIDGVFKNFAYAYTFSDTLIYGQLLAPDFTFIYRDYDKGVDVSWGRSEEMKVSHGLFENTQRLDLVWNKILSITSDSTNIVRSFNLTITFNPTDIVFVDGRVNLDLKNNEGKWQIVRWVDESNF